MLAGQRLSWLFQRSGSPDGWILEQDGWIPEQESLVLEQDVWILEHYSWILEHKSWILEQDGWIRLLLAARGSSVAARSLEVLGPGTWSSWPRSSATPAPIRGEHGVT